MALAYPLPRSLARAFIARPFEKQGKWSVAVVLFSFRSIDDVAKRRVMFWPLVRIPPPAEIPRPRLSNPTKGGFWSVLPQFTVGDLSLSYLTKALVPDL
jgi:hypothetical protein